MDLGGRAVVAAGLLAWSAAALALFDEDGACQDASAQIKSARADLAAVLQQYQQCITGDKEVTCEAEFAKLRDGQSSYREAVEHRQQACAY